MKNKNDASRETTHAGAVPLKSDNIRINGIDLSSRDLHRELARAVEHISDLELEIDKLRAENRSIREESRRLGENNARLEEMLREFSLERAEPPTLAPTGGTFFPESLQLWQNQRVAVLVDVQNMYYSAKKIYNSKISFRKLLPVLLRSRKLIRAVAYTVEKEGADQEKFYEVLRRSGFEIKWRELIVRSDGSRKGDWDMGIAIDAISLADKVDVIVLVTGDGDFVALVNMLRGRGVRVEVASFRESTADNLMLAANDHFNIDGRMLVD